MQQQQRNEESEILLLITAILAALKGQTKEKKEIIDELTLVLRRQKKEHLLLPLLEKLEKNYLRRRKVTLIFSREQPLELVETIKEKLGSVLGRDKIFEIIIDKSIIGGFRVKTDKVLIKASIKDFLNAI
ncbi:MAG: F0F1 ATP synthase subunit delta [bacterium]